MKNFRRFALAAAFLVATSPLFTQPWLSALMICTSNNGLTFSTPTVFEDSSGVPSVIQLADSTLICAFQWFPAPMFSPGWDSIAIKTSNDNGATWSAPLHCNFSGIPSAMQRPFDPTLVQISTGEIRMYFSSGILPPGPLDSNINTYSAISNDGINYVFEGTGPIFSGDSTTRAVIDPACTFFNGLYHYTAPIGTPQDGAYHCTSADGTTFTRLANIPSDASHNWTGNLLSDSGLIKFYGAGSAGIWMNSSPNGNTWNGFLSTNIVQGGDPSVVRLFDGSYILIYVGPPSTMSIADEASATSTMDVFPNPVQTSLTVITQTQSSISVVNVLGETVMAFTCNGRYDADVSFLPGGVYFVRNEETGECVEFVKE
ncbi:MAG TPA: T9SS type A sorting domain-containing protein [Bacteroidia bacterium]|nr:T9SS type A sorting domain-containing protein [Bacteroidia bacterium]